MEKKTRSSRKGIKLKPTAMYLARLEEVKMFIRDYWTEHHYSPSIKEIAAHFGTSTSGATWWINSLEEAGWLEKRLFGVARNLVPVEIFAGRDVFPIENVGPSPLERVLPILHDQLGKMTEFPGIDIGTGEDHTVEVLIEKMTDGRIAIVAAKKIDKETP